MYGFVYGLVGFVYEGYWFKYDDFVVVEFIFVYFILKFVVSG